MLRHPIALVLSGTLATVALSAPTALTVTTSAVTNVGTETATGNGDITSLGTDNPTQYGVCWSTSPGPTTSDSKTSEGATSSTGPFTSQITGLAPGVTYYVRAYVTNSSQGTAYGDEQTFTTLTPVATSSGSGLAAIDGDPVVVDAEIVTAGGDVDGYRIIISENLAAGDVLSYTGTLPVGMSASYDATAGTLLFSGTATAAEWQALLRTVTFATTNPTTGTRTITFSAGLALPFADNGHFYEFVSYPSISWGLAKARAELESYFGLAGYLVTVTSAAENDFVVAKLSGEGWMGAHDYASEGEWRWVTGPEGLENSGAGRVFFQQSAAATSSGNLNSVYGGNTPGGGAPVNGEYNAWVPAPVEPNDYGASGEDYAHFLSDGTWNDYPDFTHSIRGYVVEYGGMPGDPTPQTTATRALKVVEMTLPTVTTATPTNVTSDMADVGGTVTDDGNGTVTDRGVCWNTSGTPTTADEVSAASSGGTGAFSLSLTELTASTTYYVRAWATNSTGTAYGDEQTFTTSAQPPEPEEEEPLAPELQLEVVANEQAAFVGDLVEYGLTVRNTGDGEASEVKLFVPLPENTEFVGAYRGEDETARGAALPAELVAGTIEIVVGEVGPGQRAAVEVVLRAVKSGPVQLTASASSAQTPDAKLAEAPATAQVQDDYIEITRTPLPLCGPLGLMPLALMLCLVGWRRWRY